MKRGKPLARGTKGLKRTEFKRSTEPSLKRTAWRPKRKPEDPALTAARKVVQARSGGRCEVRSRVCVGVAGPGPHHVLRRPHMTRDHWHDPALMLDSCPPCHSYLHAHVAESLQRGWLIHALPSSGAAPVAVD